MKFRNTLLLFGLLCFVISLQAQDRHFTLYQFSPVNLNPALTGAFEGTVRLGGIYRAQGFGGDDFATYSTPSFYADAPILTVRKRDWVSIGVDFIRDQAGSIDLGYQWFKTSAAYHLSLDKKRNSVLSAGVRWGQVTRSYDPTNIRQEIPETQLTNVTNPNKTGFPDWGGGLMLRSKLNKTTSLEIGIAADHLTTPGDNNSDRVGSSSGNTGTPGNSTADGYNYITNRDTSLTTPNTNNPIDRVAHPFLWTGHGKVEMPLNEKMSIAPSFLVQATRGAFEGAVQVPIGFHFNKENNQVLHAGLGYRVGDALQVLLGYDYKTVRIGASYDLTLSEMREIRQGGFEVGVSYIIKIYKQPKVEPSILCPRF